jgi:phage shock protein PspC (stress-responsive transcriptional regulator)
MCIDLKHLRASSTDRQWCGVCGGFGASTPIPAWLWRAVFVLLALWRCEVIVGYLVIALFMPQAAAPATAAGAAPDTDTPSVPVRS